MEQKLKEFEEKLYIQEDSFMIITNGELDEALAARKGEEFVLYDSKKKNGDGQM